MVWILEIGSFGICSDAFIGHQLYAISTMHFGEVTGINLNAIELYRFRAVKTNHFNLKPYKPSIAFVGYANSVDPDQMASDQCSYCLLTECSIKIWEKWRIPPNAPKIRLKYPWQTVNIMICHCNIFYVWYLLQDPFCRYRVCYHMVWLYEWCSSSRAPGGTRSSLWPQTSAYHCSRPHRTQNHSKTSNE